MRMTEKTERSDFIKEKYRSARCLALDLDGTTLRSDGTLSEAVAAALKEAVGLGLGIIVASGRSFASLPREVLALGVAEYALCSNGATAHRISDGELLFGSYLPAESVEPILDCFSDELLEAFVGGRAYCDSRYYADPMSYGCSEHYVRYVLETRTPVPDMPKFIREHIHELDSIDVRGLGSRDVESLVSRVSHIPGLFVTSSAPGMIELGSAEAGKGKALTRLAGLIGLRTEEIIAFGNGDNDAELLSAAGLGIAVANATESCREAAGLICRSCDEDGLALIIDELKTERKGE